MSINMDLKKLREAFGLFELMQALPICFASDSGCSVTYDGEWLEVVGAAGTNPAMRTRVSYDIAGTNSYSFLCVCATMKAPANDKNWYWFFKEPSKTQISEYEGFYSSADNYRVWSTNGGTKTETIIGGQDWTVEHLFSIYVRHDRVHTEFRVDGALVATHTTNIPPLKAEFVAVEPAGVARTGYLKYPKGIYVT